MPSPEETTAAAREFLTDHPEAEDALVALLARDAEDGPWTFAETEFDSGQFGEFVSRDLATAVDDGYRLTHPDAIRTAVDAADAADSADSTDNLSASGDSTSDGISPLEFLPERTSGDLRTRLALVGVLCVVIAARLVAATDVLRDGFVVSPANDTYFFRYWQERLAARAGGIFDVGVFADMGGASSTRPLSHAINWWLTVLLGGPDVAPLVAAWLPIATAVCLGYVVYRLSFLLTGDVRVALAAVLFYGLAPTNVVYTSVGFLDHQSHQYLWLGLLAFALTALAADVPRRARDADLDLITAARAHARAPKSWVIAAGLAAAVGASAHLWGGSPLTFIPVAAVVGLRVPLDIRHDSSPVYGNAPLVGGLTVGSGLAVAAHLGLGWHETIAAVTPLLVAGGALVVVAAGELWRRSSLPATQFIIVELVVAVGGLLAYRALRPSDIERFRARAGDLFFREGMTETASLFSPDFAVVLGPLFQLGLGFYLGIAVLGVVTWAVIRRYEPGWLVLVCFAWYYMLLAAIQVRFAGQLAIFIAPFAAIGLLYLLAAIDITRPVNILGPANETDTAGNASQFQSTRTEGGSLFNRDSETDTKQDTSTLQIPDGMRMRGYLIITVTLVLLFNLILVPPLVGQTTHDRAQFDAAQSIDAHADSVDRNYPANFVLSRWDDNRMYNYFVSGESRSYGYAQQYHDQFLAAEDPDAWYDQFQDRVGYIVITDQENAPPTNSTYETLYDGYGIGANDTTATGHYQLLTADNGVRAFVMVSGALVRVNGPNGDRVTATTSVSIADETYEYSRSATLTNGTATIRVAYPGEYTVGNQTVNVSKNAVRAGNQTVIRQL
jgi:dolichyl-diphosphooligosaccharide--protein glycosyltransferase